MKVFLVSAFMSVAALMPVSADSLLNNDPDVVYMEEVNGKAIEFLVIKPATVFANKNGGRRLGAYPVDTKVTLLAMTDKGYKVKGMASHGRVSGWVSPKNLASKDPAFVENLKKFYERELAVRALIQQNEVAIGMTPEEVHRSLGEPTRKETRIDQDGQTGKWAYVDIKEVKHYHYVRDPRTGNTYRQLSHITTEEKGKVEVEFAKGVVTAIAKMEDKGPGKVKIVVPPVVFGF